ncbi:MAG: hypothetical protein CSH37_11270 [Thalassolituus sp.]|nr:MAG: hypothetical protein CSH37_11270 [Thalassolituus sp.]|tara:strand:- start:3515 stop:3724 length:210 start_codon:yes stop_codon:yes gene_type:complete
MVMKKLGLEATQRLAYKVTTKRKHSDRVADNLLNQQFTPVGIIKAYNLRQPTKGLVFHSDRGSLALYER